MYVFYKAHLSVWVLAAGQLEPTGNFFFAWFNSFDACYAVKVILLASLMVS